CRNRSYPSHFFAGFLDLKRVKFISGSLLKYAAQQLLLWLLTVFEWPHRNPNRQQLRFLFLQLHSRGRFVTHGTPVLGT
ncbi:hypothetical protein, partial [Saccharophagus degradans]